MIKVLFTALYTDENIFYFNEDSSNVVFNCNGMGILNIDFNNTNLDDTNYDEDDPILFFLPDFCLGILNLKNTKHLNEELMLIVWHSNRWWDFCMSEDEKKRIDPMFI